MSAAGPNQKSLKSAFANKRKQGPSGDNGSRLGNGRDVGNGGGGGGGWAQKRVKIRNDREIATQASDAALKDGELDLQAFLNAREFEIRALEESMRHTKSEATSRAFQQVPRGMRRRTASHNAKRVPKRLRRRALKEMAEDNTPIVVSKRRKPKTTRARIRAETAKRLGILAEKKRRNQLKAAKANAKGGGEQQEVPEKSKITISTRPPRPKIRRNQLNDPPQRKSKFRKRQINKTWLPTHLWHAKRARMTEPNSPLWRFAIPLTPNEKTYRATHRSQGEKGVVVWDTSYVSTIGLYGEAKGVEQVLRRLGVTQDSCWNDKGAKWRAGTRHWTGFLSREVKGTRRDVCPATIVWNPKAATEQVESDGGVQTDKIQRQVYVRVHPSAFLEVFNELLRLVKMQNPRLYIEDLRFEIGSIELTGPASTETLLGILHPYHTKEGSKEQHAEIFGGLAGVTNPASLPMNATLGFSVMDPRLRYPPRKVNQPNPDDEAEQIKSIELLASWPADVDLKPSGLFHRDVRASVTRLPSQKSVDKRKGARTPGTLLDVSEADPPIPVILLASRSNGPQAQGNWTVLAPWRCIQPLWHSLVHFPLSSGGNPRFSGLNEMRQVAFERNLPCFPFDFLGTDAGAEWELEQRAKRKQEWERRPKSKRVAWESLDLGAGRKGEVGSGWACDIEILFRQKTTESQDVRSPDEMDMDAPSSPEQEATSGPAPNTGDFLKTLHQLRKDAFRAHTSSPASNPLPPRSVINVRIAVLNRGVATSCARIYRLPSRPAPVHPASSAEVPATVPPPPTSVRRLPADLRNQWLATLPDQAQSPKNSGRPKQQGQTRLPANADMRTRKQMLAKTLITAPAAEYPPPKPNQTDMNGHPLVPDEADLIGFVTTGAYSLSEGRATAVGCLSGEKAAEALRDGGKGREGTLCVVRNAGESIGWIARWEVV
ncbi:POPLD domain-containing protein [Colletotrichum higginsianum]|uniref:POPLD domain-containing protein n=2 Tax=Colletotrichum higginsianum TaxID=80884 RepID=H1V5K2_COLHI|nr:POPLD domain-containing protein [Colletotrichum higginsianum IMI 349063]OBR08622.1 POPLD domain-containing protein [Colletotrichum higginsianum IMI 349063]TIC96071.1 Ribonucleases P/MRP protein subunit POP1 [Colletotrichum higginsianum]CCF35504.1 POPLD domain-containing protein [Colletotrichum higginsianum]